MGPSSSTTRSRSTSDRIDTPSSDMNTQPRDRGSGMFQTAGPACLLPPAGRVGVKTRQGAGGRRVHGHERASLLDGGYAAWVKAGLPVTKEEPAITPVSPPALRLDTSRLVDRARVTELLAGRKERGGRRALVMDARAAERYRGET